MPDNAGLRIAGYCRISVDDELDRDNVSIENQKAIISDFVERKFPGAELVFFEDRDADFGFSSQCKAMRTHHIRLDKLTSSDGREIPRNVPYAMLVESSVPVVVQYSRLDTAQAELALMTTIAYPVD